MRGLAVLDQAQRVRACQKHATSDHQSGLAHPDVIGEERRCDERYARPCRAGEANVARARVAQQDTARGRNGAECEQPVHPLRLCNKRDKRGEDGNGRRRQAVHQAQTAKRDGSAVKPGSAGSQISSTAAD